MYWQNQAVHLRMARRRHETRYEINLKAAVRRSQISGQLEYRSCGGYESTTWDAGVSAVDMEV